MDPAHGLMVVDSAHIDQDMHGSGVTFGISTARHLSALEIPISEPQFGLTLPRMPSASASEHEVIIAIELPNIKIWSLVAWPALGTETGNLYIRTLLYS